MRRSCYENLKFSATLNVQCENNHGRPEGKEMPLDFAYNFLKICLFTMNGNVFSMNVVSPFYFHPN